MNICDGCNVRDGHEHRCHGKGPITVGGEFKNVPCNCEHCNNPPTLESLEAWRQAGYPQDFKFEYEN